MLSVSIETLQRFYTQQGRAESQPRDACVFHRRRGAARDTAGGAPPSGAALWAEPRIVICGVEGGRRLSSAPRTAGAAGTATMSWELLLWLLALCVLILPLVQLLRFLRADADLTLLWAEWQGRRPGEQWPRAPNESPCWEWRAGGREKSPDLH